MTKTQIEYLKELSLRLQESGFSWTHEDYFNLKEIVPSLVCHYCVYDGFCEYDKSDPCRGCFNKRHFKKK